jgi:glycosyltransferase involved in cell wall biosynthesis
MNVAFLGNSFHLTKTGSADFFIQFLRDCYGELAVVPHKEAWARLPGRTWDLLVVWQKHFRPEELEAFPSKKVVVIPMYDDTRFDAGYWKGYEKFRIVCFSSTLRDRLAALGLNVMGVTYFPDPTSLPNAAAFSDGLRGFFWPRTRVLDAGVVERLIGKTPFSRFHLHWTPDIHDDLEKPRTMAEAQIRHMEVTSWFRGKGDYLADLAASNVFFASRRLEGIGMSFLEAMAMGMCVVAPDAPTMSEYIRPGENGMLFDPDHPRALDFGRATEIGNAARASVTAGREHWLESLPELRTFLEQPVDGYRRRARPGIVLRGRSISLARWAYRVAKRMAAGRRGSE